MKQREIILINSETVTVIQSKVSQNSKIGVGYILQTYHFSLSQVITGKLTDDSNNCLDCPLSYNQNKGVSGGCYTHKGLQAMGLRSMVKRLNRLYHEGNITIPYTDINSVLSFIALVKNTYPLDLIRFGAYGEPVILGKEITTLLTELTSNFTGYTHQYKKTSYAWSKRFFMASVHNSNDLKIATAFKFRSFIAKGKELEIQGVNCPASKESDLNLSCIACKLCNGTSKGIKKNVFINIH